MHYLLVHQHAGGFPFSFVLSKLMTSHEKALHSMCVDFNVRHLEDLGLELPNLHASTRYVRYSLAWEMLAGQVNMALVPGSPTIQE